MAIKKLLVGLVLLVVASTFSLAYNITSTNYAIEDYGIITSKNSSSTNYQLSSYLPPTGAGNSSSTNYQLQIGAITTSNNGPQYNGLWTDFTSPVIYSALQTYNFSSNWTDSDQGDAVSVVWLEHNTTGALTNTTASYNTTVYWTALTGVTQGRWKYRWFANDTQGSKNSTSFYEFSVSDATAPTSTSSGQNTTTPGVLDAMKIYTYVTDDYQLDTAWLETNESITWANSSYQALSGASAWANFTWSNTSIFAGYHVGYRVWVNDTWGNVKLAHSGTFTTQPSPFSTYQTGGRVFSSVAIGDINKDGQLDILAGSNDFKMHSIKYNGTQSWASTTGGAVGSSPTLADTNNDSFLNTVYGSLDGNVYVVDRFGSAIWNFSTGSDVWSSPAVSDLDGDGNLEIGIGSANNKVFILNHLGNEVWNYTAGNIIWSSIVFSDIVGNSDKEVLFGSYDHKVYALWSNNGSEIWNYTTNEKVESTPAVQDIDGDGIKEVVFGSYDNSIYAIYGNNGTKKWSYATGGWVISSPAFCNVAGNSDVEIIVGSDDSKLYVLNKSGALVWSYSVPTGGRVESSPSCADMNGDGTTDVVVGSTDGYVYTLNGADGSVVWTYNLGSYIFATPALADVSRNGHSDVVVGTLDGRIVVIDPPSDEWSMFGGDESRSRVFDTTAPYLNKSFVSNTTPNLQDSIQINQLWWEWYTNLDKAVITSDASGTTETQTIGLTGLKDWVNLTITPQVSGTVTITVTVSDSHQNERTSTVTLSVSAHTSESPSPNNNQSEQNPQQSDQQLQQPTPSGSVSGRGGGGGGLTTAPTTLPESFRNPTENLQIPQTVNQVSGSFEARYLNLAPDASVNFRIDVPDLIVKSLQLTTPTYVDKLTLLVKREERTKRVGYDVLEEFSIDFTGLTGATEILARVGIGKERVDSTGVQKELAVIFDKNVGWRLRSRYVGFDNDNYYYEVQIPRASGTYGLVVPLPGADPEGFPVFGIKRADPTEEKNNSDVRLSYVIVAIALLVLILGLVAWKHRRKSPRNVMDDEVEFPEYDV